MARSSHWPDVAWRLSYALAAAWLISATAAPCPAAADPTISEHLSYYDLVGASPADLRAQMNALGPIDSNDGKKVWAKTRWQVNWKSAYHTQGSRCLLDKVPVAVRIDYTYPRWKNDGDGDEATRRAWTRFISALRQHERQHGQHASAG